MSNIKAEQHIEYCGGHERKKKKINKTRQEKLNISLVTFMAETFDKRITKLVLFLSVYANVKYNYTCCM